MSTRVTVGLAGVSQNLAVSGRMCSATVRSKRPLGQANLSIEDGLCSVNRSHGNDMRPNHFAAKRAAVTAAIPDENDTEVSALSAQVRLSNLKRLDCGAVDRQMNRLGDHPRLRRCSEWQLQDRAFVGGRQVDSTCACLSGGQSVQQVWSVDLSLNSFVEHYFIEFGIQNVYRIKYGIEVNHAMDKIDSSIISICNRMHACQIKSWLQRLDCLHLVLESVSAVCNGKVLPFSRRGIPQSLALVFKPCVGSPSKTLEMSLMPSSSCGDSPRNRCGLPCRRRVPTFWFMWLR